MKYSIIYIELRPEIQERLSVGIIVMTEGKADVRTSKEKLDAVKTLLTDNEYLVASHILDDMPSNIKTEQDINYLTRYSNNLITFSPLQTIDIENSEENRKWLYRNYVYRYPKRVALSA